MGSEDVCGGRVVILNGGSSAGKTTLARALQAALPAPWLLLGIDLMIWTLPPEMVDHVDGISVRNGVIFRGDPFLLLYAGFQRGVAAIAHAGVSVLIDEVTLDGAVDQGRWDDALQGLDVCWIGLRCSSDVVAEREARRRSRLPGVARHQAESVHTGVRYDLEVDTERLDLREELNVIADWLSRTWSIEVSRRSDPRSTFPTTSAWIQGTAVPAPWEH